MIQATPSPKPPPPLLKVENLRTYFPLRRGILQRRCGSIKAVDDVSFEVSRGRTLGLIGESGCGKTTVGRTLLRLIPSTAGRALFEGVNIFEIPRSQMRPLRRKMQIIFQDTAGSLNPRMRVGRIVAEPLEVHGLSSGPALQEQVEDLLKRCGLPRHAAHRFPPEFSGGQRQRIGIARALAVKPMLIICDEPTSALDVSIQAQILNLLKDLQDELGLSYLFISHDMGVIRHACDRIAVMRMGRIVEQGDRDQIIDEPRHEYTKSLLRAVPRVERRLRQSVAAD